MPNHTSGPWTCNCDTKYAQPICSVGWHVRIADGSSIAVVLGEKNPELQANAKLIATAPELLQILEGILFKWECNEPGNAQIEFQALARQLIDKVKGETNDTD